MKAEKSKANGEDDSTDSKSGNKKKDKKGGKSKSPAEPLTPPVLPSHFEQPKPDPKLEAALQNEKLEVERLQKTAL